MVSHDEAIEIRQKRDENTHTKHHGKSYYFLCLFLPAIVLTTFVLFSAYQIQINSSKEKALATERHFTNSLAETATDYLNSTATDVLLLSTHEEMKKNIVELDKEGLFNLSWELSAYCSLKPFCYKVRIISNSGMELLKIVRNEEDSIAVPDYSHTFQNKKDRYYFKETIKLEEGGVYVSPVDLNIEYGEIEIPWRPVIQIGSPIYNEDGEKQGIVVLSILGNILLERLKHLSYDSKNKHIILDPDGYWLYGGSPEDQFAFLFEDKKENSFGNRKPDIWHQISEGPSGQFDGSGYITSDATSSDENMIGRGQYTFSTLYKSGRNFAHSEFDGSLSEDVVLRDMSQAEPYWKFISYLPNKYITGNLFKRYLAVYVILVAFLMILSAFLARNRINKQESEERFKAKERQYRMLHKNAFDGIVIADESGVIIESNTSVEQAFGYEEGELIGENISVLVPEEYRKAHMEGFNRFINTGNSHVMEQVLQLEGKSKSGNVFPIELVLSQINIDGSLLLSGTIRDISERKKSEETIEKLAYYDQLTGLPNRTLFLDRLKQSISRAKRYDTLLGLLFMDFDHFKNLNDTLGHVIGDKFLKAAAERLEKFSRSSDSVARVGGDEFVIFVADQEDLSGIMVVAGKVASIFKEPFEIDGHEFFVTASIGVSVYPHDGEEVTMLMKNADTAMYKAKDEGGGTFQLYTPSMNAKALERLKLENILRRALDREEFYLDYQPQVDTETFKVVGVEALLRWRNEEKGLISPAEFIPVAETTRLIVSIGEWVLREACERIVKLHEEGLKGLNVAVNVSLYQLKDKTFMDTLTRILEETGLDPKYLELEITESVAMDNVDDSVKMLNELKSKGIRLSIDDFGTGYSSLEHLKRMPIDVLKIDMSFIRNITEDLDDRKIVETIVNIAHGFNCKVVAEGVETIEQFKVLRGFGCDIIQGYLFSKPVQPDELRGVYDEILPELISSDTGKVLGE